MIFGLIITVACKNFAHAMMGLINSNRSDAGLELLRSIQNLETAARDQALYMCENSLLTHMNPGGDLIDRVKKNGFKGNRVGENIAKSHSDEYKKVVKMWMSSLKHRKNIMGNFNYTGVATCLDKQGNRFWVQVFGKDGSGSESDENDDQVSLEDKEETAQYEKKKSSEPNKAIASPRSKNKKPKKRNIKSYEKYCEVDENTTNTPSSAMIKTVTVSASTSECDSSPRVSRLPKKSTTKNQEPPKATVTVTDTVHEEAEPQISTVTVTDTVHEEAEPQISTVTVTDTVHKVKELPRATVTITDTVQETFKVTTTKSVDRVITTVKPIERYVTATVTVRPKASPKPVAKVKIITIQPQDADAIIVMKPPENRSAPRKFRTVNLPIRDFTPELKKARSDNKAPKRQESKKNTIKKPKKDNNRESNEQESDSLPFQTSSTSSNIPEGSPGVNNDDTGGDRPGDNQENGGQSKIQDSDLKNLILNMKKLLEGINQNRNRSSNLNSNLR